MDMDIAEITQGKLHAKVTFLLMRIKMNNKPKWQELVNTWEDADLDEVQEVYKDILEAYRAI
jgi:hypothetical protein